MTILNICPAPNGFEWFNYSDYTASDAFRFEIYSKENGVLKDFTFKKLALEFLSYNSERIKIGQSTKNSIWGGFTSDVWKLKENDFAFDPSGKISIHTEKYLKLLIDSQIDFRYDGFCEAIDLSKFIDTVADCITNNIAPYSPLFFSESDQTVFYLHQTFSIGCYTKSREFIKTIDAIERRFDIQSYNF